jgi:hypothetical protein
MARALLSSAVNVNPERLFWLQDNNQNRITTETMKMNRWLLLAATAAGLCLATTQSFAQNDQANQGPPRRGNFDPAQMRERMMSRLKDQLEITDDGEWKAIEPLIEKVIDARGAAMSGMRGMFGPPRRQNGDTADPAARRGMFGQTSAESDALQKAIDAKASNSELKAAIAKYAEYRKAKQAELEKAQADLLKVLTVRQEAIATLNGLL